MPWKLSKMELAPDPWLVIHFHGHRFTKVMVDGRLDRTDAHLDLMGFCLDPIGFRLDLLGFHLSPIDGLGPFQ